MKRLRLTLVTHYFPSHRGGVEIVAGELARRLAETGAVEIVWFASATDAPPPEAGGLRCVAVPACNFTERRLGFPFPIWGPRALAAVARAMRASDVVHIHDCVYLPTSFASLAAKLAGKPVLVTQHVGMVPYKSALLRGLLASANRVLGSLVLGSATRTVFVSEVVLRYFSRFVRFRSPPLRIANGVDTTVFSPSTDRTTLRAELGLPPARPVLIFAGRFVEKKGLALLRRLAERMPGATWLFAGWGPLDPGSWNLANVRVERNLAQRELARYYQAADLLVLPSVGEGFPLVVQEAMASGTPALVSAETAAAAPEAAGVLAAEALGDGAEARWQARIEALLADHDLRSRVANVARSEWSWTRCAERYAELLRACAA